MSSLAAIKRSIALRVATLKHQVASDLFDRITHSNPVASGRSRASWRAGVGTVDATPAPKPAGTIIAAGAPALPPATFPALPLADAGVPILIANDLPYVPRLEQGYSAQAPAGFIGLSIDATVRSVPLLAAGLKE
jgi:hypothetical protein